MAIFLYEDHDNGKLDYRLLENGSINLYHKKEILDKDVDWLKEKRYEIISFDCLDWKNKEDFYKEFSEKLSFPADMPATNLDSLDDWIRDVKFEDTGKILIFLNFDHLLDNIETRLGLHLLDILETHSRRNLLLGNRLITILQTKNPAIEITGFGAIEAQWNSQEWSYENRGIKKSKKYQYEEIK